MLVSKFRTKLSRNLLGIDGNAEKVWDESVVTPVTVEGGRESRRENVFTKLNVKQETSSSPLSFLFDNDQAKQKGKVNFYCFQF